MTRTRKVAAMLTGLTAMTVVVWWVRREYISLAGLIQRLDNENQQLHDKLAARPAWWECLTDHDFWRRVDDQGEFR